MLHLIDLKHVQCVYFEKIFLTLAANTRMIRNFLKWLFIIYLTHLLWPLTHLKQNKILKFSFFLTFCYMLLFTVCRCYWKLEYGTFTCKWKYFILKSLSNMFTHCWLSLNPPEKLKIKLMAEKPICNKGETNFPTPAWKSSPLPLLLQTSILC